MRTAKVSGIDESKKNGIDTILSSNGIGEDNSYTVSVSKNNIQGGIKVTVPVLLPSVKAGDNVYVYCYNEKTGKLEEIANSKRMVLNDKTAGIEINSEKDYIVTDKELSGKNVVTLLDKSKVKFNKTTVKKRQNFEDKN